MLWRTDRIRNGKIDDENIPFLKTKWSSKKNADYKIPSQWTLWNRTRWFFLEADCAFHYYQCIWMVIFFCEFTTTSADFPKEHAFNGKFLCVVFSMAACESQTAPHHSITVENFSFIRVFFFGWRRIGYSHYKKNGQNEKWKSKTFRKGE